MGGSKELKGMWAIKAYKMLVEVSGLLDKHKIPYVLEAGTLLGVIREGRLLPWDTDLDITVLHKHASKIYRIKWHLFLKGYRMRVRKFKYDVGPFKKGDIRIIKIQTTRFGFFKDQSLMDIFVKYKIGNECFWALKGERYMIKKSPSEYYESTTQIDFLGNRFSIPLQAEEYLAYHYGNDWRTPVYNWNYLLDDHCEKISE